MLLQGAMLKVGLRLSRRLAVSEVAEVAWWLCPRVCPRVCGGCAEVVWRMCGGCRGIGRWGNECMSYVGACAVAVLEHVQRMCGGLWRAAESVWSMCGECLVIMS